VKTESVFMPRFTKRIVDEILSNKYSKETFIWEAGDGALKGLGIRIKPSGSASYIVQYRNQEGRTRRMVLGRTNVLTPDEARIQAREKLAEVAKGSDPSANRHAVRHSLTVAELCDLYVAEGMGHVKPSTYEANKRRIENHVKPLLGRRTVNSLTLEDIERFQNQVAIGKAAQFRREKGRGKMSHGGRGAAARNIGMFSAILEFAKRRRIITNNPARGVRKFADKKRTRFLSYEEITALGTAMREMAFIENTTGVAALRALLLTGCRRNEILGLPWAWLDAKACCIRFEDTKTGPQLRTIGNTAARFLEAQPHQKNDASETVPWVFPAYRGNGHFIGLRRVLDRLCDKVGLKDVTIHTLRHTFAATAAELGFSELTIAGMLGHKVSGITARYAHVPDRALLIAADQVSARIMAALEGKKEGNVLEMQISKISEAI